MEGSAVDGLVADPVVDPVVGRVGAPDVEPAVDPGVDPVIDAGVDPLIDPGVDAAVDAGLAPVVEWVGDLDGSATADALAASRDGLVAAEVAQMRLIAHWADLHGFETR